MEDKEDSELPGGQRDEGKFLKDLPVEEANILRERLYKTERFNLQRSTRASEQTLKIILVGSFISILGLLDLSKSVTFEIKIFFSVGILFFLLTVIESLLSIRLLHTILTKRCEVDKETRAMIVDNILEPDFADKSAEDRFYNACADLTLSGTKRIRGSLDSFQAACGFAIIGLFLWILANFGVTFPRGDFLFGVFEDGLFWIKCEIKNVISKF